MVRLGGGEHVCFARAIKMFRKAPTSFQTKYPQFPQRARDREVCWIMNGYLCDTDALLFSAVQSRGIPLILRKRLAASFPVY